MSTEERNRLVSEIREREMQVAEMREQVDAKTAETNRLKREVGSSPFPFTLLCLLYHLV